MKQDTPNDHCYFLNYFQIIIGLAYDFSNYAEEWCGTFDRQVRLGFFLYSKLYYYKVNGFERNDTSAQIDSFELLGLP